MLWWASSGAIPFNVVVGWLAGASWAPALFNFIPGFPLDGGRVLRSILWYGTSDLRRATRIASLIGRVVARAFILWGLWEIFTGYWANGMWISFISRFLYSAAVQSYQQLVAREELRGHIVREAMTACRDVPCGLTLDTLVEQVALPAARGASPWWTRAGACGSYPLQRMRELPRDQRPVTRVEDAMVPVGELQTVRPSQDLRFVLQRTMSEDLDQNPVIEDGRSLGMVTRDSLRRDLAA